MTVIKIFAIGLIAAGLLALVYGGFRYTKETHMINVGPMEVSVKDRERVNIPVWAGVGAVALGGTLLVLPIGRKNN